MWMPIIVMAEEKEHPISHCSFDCIKVFRHEEAGRTFFPDRQFLKDLLWLSSSGPAELQRLLALRLPFQSEIQTLKDNCKVKRWCPCLQTPSTWAKLQQEWILHIVCIAYFHRIFLSCVWFLCFLDVRVQCSVGIIYFAEREMEILGLICCLFYTPYARGELRRTACLIRAPLLCFLEHIALAAVLESGVEVRGSALKTWSRFLSARNLKPKGNVLPWSNTLKPQNKCLPSVASHSFKMPFHN